MERVREQSDVFMVVAGLAIFIILYSLWGASILRGQQEPISQGSDSVAANL